MRLEALVFAPGDAGARETATQRIRDALREPLGDEARVSLVSHGAGMASALNEGLRAAMARRPGWDAILLVRASEDLDADAVRALLDRCRARDDLGIAEARTGEVVLVGAACLEAIGLFDETFDEAFALEDLAARARLAGFFVSTDRARAVRASTVRTTAWLEARAHYLTKHHGAAYRRVADVALALGGAWTVSRERARGIRSEESRRWLHALLRQASSRGR